MKATAGSVTTNLLYDPLGRLFQTDKGTTATTTKFLYDGDDVENQDHLGDGSFSAWCPSSATRTR